MSPSTDDYVLARLASVEATIKSYCASVEEWKEANHRLGQAREQSIINSVFGAVKTAMGDERENSRNLFASLEAKLSSYTTIQDSAIDSMRSDLSEMRIEVTSHGAHIKAQNEINAEITRKLKAVHDAVHKMTDAPGEKAKKTLQLVGAGAVPVAGYGLFTLLKHLLGAK